MKIHAARANETDRTDIEILAKRTRIISSKGMLKCYKMFYPDEQVKERSIAMAEAVAISIAKTRKRSGDVR